MAAQPPALADLQKQFLDAVMRGDAAILDHIPANSRTTNATLLGVYQHAYAARLVEVVRNDHAILATYMGDEAFEVMARRYIAAHPSRHPNARWFASALPEFLTESADYRAFAELAEIAALERALGTAFDAVDAPVLDVAGLARHPPETWGGLVFTPHPSVSLLQCTTNAFDIWRALKDDGAPPAAEALTEAQVLLVWRPEAIPRVRVVPSEEAMMWSEAARGVAFGRLCELVAVFGGAENADARSAEYLLGWLNEGMLKGVV
jgi:hypothetical protein